MFRMKDTEQQQEEPPSPNASEKPVHPCAAYKDARQNSNGNGSNGNGNGLGSNGKSKDESGVVGRVINLLRGKHDTTLRETIEEFILTSSDDESSEDEDHISQEERHIISNVLNLRDMKAIDVMIPRADIVAVDIETSQSDLLSLLSERQFSRLPVYRDNMDDIAGTIHIKDILATLAANDTVVIEDMVREVPIVSPSMQVIDLLLMMREIKKHMVLVVDEFGGIDGLITVGDVTEAIIGEIDDEYDLDEDPQVIENDDGTLTVDARLPIDELEEKLGTLIEEDEEEDIDTVGGLMFYLAGRVPARGEVLSHESTGLVFEVLDADPRRINRVLIRFSSLPSDMQDA